MITTIKPMKSLSTVRSEIFLFKALPAIPQEMPPITINASITGSNSGTLLVTTEDKRLATWENKIIYKELEKNPDKCNKGSSTLQESLYRLYYPCQTFLSWKTVFYRQLRIKM